MRTSVTKKVFSIILAALMLLSALPLTLAAGASDTATPDPSGATVTTEKGTDYTTITYSMTAGTNGTSKAYCVNVGDTTKNTETYYCGGLAGKGVIYKIPILHSDSLEAVSLTAKLYGAYDVDVSLDNMNYENVASGAKWTENGGNVDFELGATLTNLLEDQEANCFYIRFFNSVNSWDAPKVYELSVKAVYRSALDIKNITDTQTTYTYINSSNVYTKTAFSVTAGTNGTSVMYLCDRDVAAKDSESYYSVGQKEGKTAIYKFSMDDGLYLQKLILSADISTLHTIYVSLDNLNWTCVYLNSSTSQTRITKTMDISTEVHSLMEPITGNAEYLYIKFENKQNWNHAYLYGFDLAIYYDGIYTLDTDENGATVATVLKDSSIEKTYSMTAGNKGTGGNYCIASGYANKNKDDCYCGSIDTKQGVIYKIPLSEGILKDGELSVTIYGVYMIAVSVDNFEWTNVASGEHYNVNVAVDVSLTDSLKAIGVDNAEYVYIRFYHTSNWNAPLVYGFDLTLSYMTGVKAEALDVSLDGDIGLHFGLSVDEAILNDSNTRVEFVGASGEVIKSIDPTEDGAYEVNGGYQFFRLDLAPADMAKSFKIQVKNGDEVFADDKEYSVVYYATEMLKSDTTTAEAKELIKSMLNYGAYAQSYFGVDTDTPANSGFEYTTELDAVTAPDVAYTHTAGETVKATTYNVELEAKVKINVLFSDGTVLTREVAADELDDELEFVNGDCSFKVSVLCYASQMLSRDDTPEALELLIKSMILYNNAANAYFN